MSSHDVSMARVRRLRFGDAVALEEYPRMLCCDSKRNDPPTARYARREVWSLGRRLHGECMNQGEYYDWRWRRSFQVGVEAVAASANIQRTQLARSEEFRYLVVGKTSLKIEKSQAKEYHARAIWRIVCPKAEEDLQRYLY